MQRILAGLGMIVFVGAIVVGATGAFFSDTETSTGNTFAAGELDLTIDNTSYGFDWNDPENQDPTGQWGLNAANSWALADLTNQLFFDFHDLKPGDYGEDTISMHVQNDAWACMAFDLTGTPENGVNEPEADFPDTTDGADEGELQNYLSFLFWYDDGDNVLEDDEIVIDDLSGLPGDAFSGEWLAITDSESQSEPLQAGETTYIGKGWCFGEITPTPAAPADNPDGPTPGNTGFTCDGAGDHNDAQTDGIVVDVHFYAEQARNNPSFSCSDLPDPTPPNGENGEQGPFVGAALGDYTQPTGEACDLTVDNDVAQAGDNYNTIQAAVDAASPGQTICVAEGVYDEDVVVNVEGLTLTGDGAIATSVIDGQAGGQGAAVTIAANNVTLEGFEINGAGIAALWLNTGVSGATVQYNKITSAAGGVTAVTTQGDQSNHNFNNNEFVGTGSGQIVYVNGEISLGAGQESDDVDFDNNTFSGTIVAGGVALGSESTNSEVTNNVFEATLTSTYALYESWKDDAMVNFNNFYDTLGIIVRDSDPGAGPLNAEDNWWGEAIPAGHTAGDVDDDPKEAAAFPEN